jgi:hypothetical protein
MTKKTLIRELYYFLSHQNNFNIFKKIKRTKQALFFFYSKAKVVILLYKKEKERTYLFLINTFFLSLIFIYV